MTGSRRREIIGFRRIPIGPFSTCVHPDLLIAQLIHNVICRHLLQYPPQLHKAVTLMARTPATRVGRKRQSAYRGLSFDCFSLAIYLEWEESPVCISRKA